MVACLLCRRCQLVSLSVDSMIKVWDLRMANRCCQTVSPEDWPKGEDSAPTSMAYDSKRGQLITAGRRPAAWRSCMVMQVQFHAGSWTSRCSVCVKLARFTMIRQPTRQQKHTCVAPVHTCTYHVVQHARQRLCAHSMCISGSLGLRLNGPQQTGCPQDKRGHRGPVAQVCFNSAFSVAVSADESAPFALWLLQALAASGSFAAACKALELHRPVYRISRGATHQHSITAQHSAASHSALLLVWACCLRLCECTNPLYLRPSA